MFLLGTNDEQGSLFVAGMDREPDEFHSNYYVRWEGYPDQAMHFKTWMDADAFRSQLCKKVGIEPTLYIWEWHPG